MKSAWPTFCLLMVLLTGLSVANGSARPTVEDIRDACNLDRNNLINVTEWDPARNSSDLIIRLDETRVKNVNCSKIDSYDFSDYPIRERNYEIKKPDKGSFPTLIVIGLIIGGIIVLLRKNPRISIEK